MFPNDTTIIAEIRSNATILNYLSSLIEIQGNQQVINTYAEATVQHCRVRLDQPDMCRLAFRMRSAAVATERGRGKQWARARSAWSGKPPARRAACCIGIFRSSCRCRRSGAPPAPVTVGLAQLRPLQVYLREMYWLVRVTLIVEIGRASCRERVSSYV